MQVLYSVFAGLTAAAVGLVGGYVVGKAARGKAPWHYWTANVLVLVAGVASAGAASVWASRPLLIASLAFIGAGLTGLKYGLAKVVTGLPGRGAARVPDDRSDRPAAR